MIAIYRPSAKVLQLVRTNGTGLSTRVSALSRTFDEMPTLRRESSSDTVESSNAVFAYTDWILEGYRSGEATSYRVHCFKTGSVNWKPRLPSVASSTHYSIDLFNLSSSEIASLSQPSVQTNDNLTQAIETMMSFVMLSDSDTVSAFPSWSPTVHYSSDSAVFHDRILWSSSASNLNSEPHDNSSDWSQESTSDETPMVWRGQWSNNTSYAFNHVVFHAGQSWVCNVNNVRSPPWSNDQLWSIVSGSEFNPPTLNARTSLTVDQIEPLSSYAARRLALGCMVEKDLCPITLEPLAFPVQVNVCYHVLSKTDHTLTTCPVCSQPASWRIVDS